MNRFQFVADHRNAYGVKRLCEVIEVARSSFYAWRGAAPRRAAKAAEDAALAERIRAVQDPARGGDRAYGAPRVTAELNDDAEREGRVNHKRVARVMRAHGLAGIRLRERVTTTDADQSARRFPDLVGRDFSIGEPGLRYVGDIPPHAGGTPSYLPIADGTNLFLSTCIDLGSRKLAGWSMADHMRSELVKDTLTDAARKRGSLAGAIFHSDHARSTRGRISWRTARVWGCSSRCARSAPPRTTRLLNRLGAALKRELLAGRPAFSDQATAYRAVFRWAARYNTRRRHSALGNITPNTYETAAAATLPEAA
ncbi:IS3 family transposase [Gordonia sp. (in: high G+C Gram-positive bacteria)]|uniref:IS3 family transposase n=1 Tax=Gordonia sp. (in: high G+C Gram-positive bacteria) TaxID=84139 RepID=UPI003C735AFE